MHYCTVIVLFVSNQVCYISVNQSMASSVHHVWHTRTQPHAALYKWGNSGVVASEMTNCGSAVSVRWICFLATFISCMVTYELWWYLRSKHVGLKWVWGDGYDLEKYICQVGPYTSAWTSLSTISTPLVTAVHSSYIYLFSSVPSCWRSLSGWVASLRVLLHKSPTKDFLWNTKRFGSLLLPSSVVVAYRVCMC